VQFLRRVRFPAAPQENMQLKGCFHPKFRFAWAHLSAGATDRT
jgi:hypothetical protein